MVNKTRELDGRNGREKRLLREGWVCSEVVAMPAALENQDASAAEMQIQGTGKGLSTLEQGQAALSPGCDG